MRRLKVIVLPDAVSAFNGGRKQGSGSLAKRWI